MNTAVATTETKTLTVADTVRKMGPEFALLLKTSGTDPDKFMNNALLAINSIAEIKSGEVNRGSVFNVCSRAANEGLVLDGKEAAIVIGWNGKAKQKEAQYRRMAGGVMKLIRRSADIERVACQLVYENDDFVVDFVTDAEPIRHTINPDALKKGRGELVGVYFVAKLRSGEWTSPEVMSVDEVEAVRNAFSQKDRDGNFSKMWRDAFGEAARKTVLHRAVKRLPLGEGAAAEGAANAIKADIEEAGETIDQETGEIHEPAAEKKPRGGKKAADLVKNAAQSIEPEDQSQEITEADYHEVPAQDDDELPL